MLTTLRKKQTEICYSIPIEVFIFYVKFFFLISSKVSIQIFHKKNIVNYT